MKLSRFIGKNLFRQIDRDQSIRQILDDASADELVEEEERIIDLADRMHTVFMHIETDCRGKAAATYLLFLLSRIHTLIENFLLPFLQFFMNVYVYAVRSEYGISGGSTIQIGRSIANHASINSLNVSRHKHLTVKCAPSSEHELSVTVTPKEFVWLNDELQTAGTPFTVRPSMGDLVRVGHLKKIRSIEKFGLSIQFHKVIQKEPKTTPTP